MLYLLGATNQKVHNLWPFITSPEYDKLDNKILSNNEVCKEVNME